MARDYADALALGGDEAEPKEEADVESAAFDEVWSALKGDDKAAARSALDSYVERVARKCMSE